MLYLCDSGCALENKYNIIRHAQLHIQKTDCLKQPIHCSNRTKNCFRQPINYRKSNNNLYISTNYWLFKKICFWSEGHQNIRKKYKYLVNNQILGIFQMQTPRLNQQDLMTLFLKDEKANLLSDTKAFKQTFKLNGMWDESYLTPLSWGLLAIITERKFHTSEYSKLIFY